MLISSDSDGVQGNGYSWVPAISSDGHFVVFSSGSSNLVSGSSGQIYRKNLDDGDIDLVSSTSAGDPSDVGADYPSVSANGRFVAFTSQSSNLVPADTDGQSWGYESDIFRKDLLTGQVEVVSVNSDEESANGASGYLDGDYYDQTVTDISGDGRFVAFTSDATNLALTDTNRLPDVFIRDLQAGTTSLISVTTNGLQGNPAFSGGNNGSTSPSISSDGRFVAFMTAESLDPSDQNYDYDIYLRDRATSTTTFVSNFSNPVGGASYFAWSPAISDDGQYLAFEKLSRDASSGIYLHDISTGTNSLVVAGNLNEFPALSADGNIVTFQRLGASRTDIYRLDRSTGISQLVTKGCFDNDLNQNTRNSWRDDTVSGDGNRIAFWHFASNLVAQDLNGSSDIYVWDANTTDETNSQCAVDPKSMASAQTWGRGLHSAGCSICRGDPVNTATGNFTEGIVDLSMPGIGMPFRWVRTYNSADDRSGPLGQGWTHSFDASVVVQPDSSVLFRAEDGARVTFMPNGDGSYSSAAGARSTLSDKPSGGQRLVSKSQLEYLFDEDGKLETLRDRNGNELSLSYLAGQLDSITDTVGRVISVDYDLAGHITQVGLPDGRSVQYSYTNDLLTSVTDPRGNTTEYSYGTSGRLTDAYDENGDLAVHNTYGSDGRVVAQTDGRGEITDFAWDPDAQTATTTDPLGNEWKDVYKNNLLAEQIDPLGHVRSLRYDDALNIKKVTDELGHSTSLTYDARGNLLSRTSPDSFSEAWTYNARNDVISYRDRRWIETAYTYDSNGNLSTVVRPGGITTTLARDASGQITSITDAMNKTTTLHHDPDGNLDLITTPLGSKTKFTYDSTGRRTTMVEARGMEVGASEGDFTWTYAYDGSDHVTSVVDPLGHGTTFEFDPTGRFVSQVDAENRPTTYDFNPAGDLLSVTAADLTSTSYEYDPAGNLVARTDANGHTTAYGFDAAHHLVSVISPQGDERRWTYDAAGNVTTEVTARGSATSTLGDGMISYSYDSLDRLVAMNYSDQTPDVSFAYDPSGNRVEMTDGQGSALYEYDLLDRLTKVTRGGSSFIYGYDPVDHVVDRTYPDGTLTHYQFDSDGRMSKAINGTHEASYTYNSANLQTGVDYPNGIHETKTYDAAGRLSTLANKLGAATISSFAYLRDGVGNPTSIATNAGSTYFAYDALHRLTQECSNSPCSTSGVTKTVYAYDPVGNRLTKTAAAGTTSYSYNSDDELLSAAGPSATTSYTYDADGNMLTAGAKAYAYDLENRMTSSSSGAITTSYTYDGDGNRRTLSGGANQLRFAWDTNYAVPQLATEYQGATPAVLRDYVYGRQRIAMKQAGNVAHYYQHDGLGSVVGVTGNDGSQEWSYAYDAFGNSLTTTKVAPLAPANPMRFTGQYFDPSGLYAFEARSYDSSLGRFLQTDPIGADLDTPFSGSYGYVGNRATVMVDPDGRSAVIADSPWWVGVGEVLGGATLGAAGAVTGGLGLLVYVAIDSQDPVPPFDASPCPVSDPNFDPVTAINPWQPNPGPAELDRILGQQENVVSKGDPVLHGGPGRPPGGRWGGIAAGGAAASGVVYCLISGKCGE